MRSLCTTKPPRVKTDASHLGIRLSETGKAFAVGRGFPGLAPSADIGGLPLEQSLAGLLYCTPESSTDVPGHTSSTQPPGARIGCKSSIARRAWVLLPSPRATRWVRLDPISPILSSWGSSPVDGSGLDCYILLARCRLIFSSRLSLIKTRPMTPDSSIHDFDR